ncbi:MAG: hypothetical protein LBT09_11515 [Planctomycetaceae bacterium]|jgi:uncharacterized membrane protein|nr:hypothetical protein [Planctomycetaceae bacterium]
MSVLVAIITLISFVILTLIIGVSHPDQVLGLEKTFIGSCISAGLLIVGWGTLFMVYFFLSVLHHKIKYRRKNVLAQQDTITQYDQDCPYSTVDCCDCPKDLK